MYAQSIGKNIAPLFNMINEFDDSIKNLPFCFLFTSTPALIGLKNLGYHATGTIRDHIVPKSCPLPTKYELKKRDRGTIFSTKMSETNIKITKWVDNAVVSVASTLFGKLPVASVSRYSRVERSRITIPCPSAIKEYNKCMGGTDRMDQNVNAYRIGIRGKKWWFSIFTWLVDVSVQNAWFLHRAGGSNMPQLDFRRQIAARYCSSLGESKVAKNYRRPKTAMESIPRFDNMGHYLVHVPEVKRRRCAGALCSKVCRTMCKKCDVGLCIDCNENYHLLST
jgi:hypothetical protein